MSVEIIIPSPGESVNEVTVGTWLKQDGEWVEQDEAICEIESDKATLEVGAPVAGRLECSAKAGEELDVGAVLGTINDSAERPEPVTEDVEEAVSHAAPKAGGTSKAKGGGKGKTRGKDKASKVNGTVSQEAATTEDGAKASTMARKIAEERGVDLSAVSGSGPAGRIMKADVLSAIEPVTAPGGSTGTGQPDRAVAPAAAPPPPTGSRGVRRERMTKLRQKIAERLVSAQHTAAMLTTFNEVDMTQVMEVRARHKEAFEKSHGVRLGFMSFFVKAAVAALRSCPKVNAYIVDNEIEYHDYNDVAVAVGTDRGLVVPVIRNAEALSFAQIEATIADFAARARDGALSVDEMTGGTFTVSNGGVYGSMMSTPILNPPQSGILGMHAIKKRAVEDPGNPGSIALRPMMYLAFSYDHRIIDGTEAVTFLKHIKDCIEDPTRILLDA
ncbi:MAG: 2-oxoglutarate dehydrogenase complex dihydrolipoyllysine-residue succinyltransferase [Planctomycetota bacterium]|nr:2-oxoglutarate dehydrogenase complex dihydrolipoyllysine-residue succinyltransferase [Planctomycetota bacterium]MED5507451.1 2-oxoglutarate dehydrogenase complex dihydrolipoyllysine-residue succinyltransferase [Planctomycetota bacterium]